MRPSGLTNNCARCDELMPFDPSAQNQLCNGCNRLLALGDLPMQDSMLQQDRSIPSDMSSSFSQSPVTPTNYQGFSYATSPQTPMIPTYQGFIYPNEPQPTVTPQSYPYMGYSPSPQSIMTASALKRKHMDEEEYGHDGEYPNKRSFATAYAPNTPSGLRQVVNPASIDSNEAVDGATSENGGEEAEDGEEFVDAQEDQGTDVRAAVGAEQEMTEADAGGEASEDEVVPAAEKVQDETLAAKKGVEEIDDQPAEAQHEDEDDLFAQTFGKSAPKNDNSDDEDDNDNEAVAAPAAASGVEPTTAFNHKAFIANLASNAPSKQAPTITTSKPKKPTPKEPQTGYLPLTLPTHLSHNLRKQASFHATALHFLPRLPLAAHRYWIGVHKLGVPPRATQSEKNFIWMKGNRKTTVETVWRAFCRSSAVERDEGVVLLVGFERVGLGVRCEELDYFNDKRVIFRAVPRDHKDAEGRMLAQELIKEVVALDGEGEAPAGGDKSKGKEKVVEREVIEIG